MQWKPTARRSQVCGEVCCCVVHLWRSPLGRADSAAMKKPPLSVAFLCRKTSKKAACWVPAPKRERGAPSPTWEVGCCLGPFGGPPVPATDRPSVCVRVYRRWRLSPSRHIVVTTPNAPLAFFLGCHFFLMPSGCASRVDHRPLDSGSSRSSSWAAG